MVVVMMPRMVVMVMLVLVIVSKGVFEDSL